MTGSVACTRQATLRPACWALVAGLLLVRPALAPGQTRLPDLTGPVNDFAGVIDAASAARIDELSRTLQQATGDTIVVVTVRTFRPQFGDIREFAVKLFENNGRGIGERGKDNGLLIVLAVDDRQVWTEVGYGLEGAITDGFAGETARLHMAPAFRRGDYGAGLLAGVTRFASRIAEERGVRLADLPPASPSRPRQRQEELALPLWAVLLLILIIYVAMRTSGGSSMRGFPSTRTRGGHVWGPTTWSGWTGGGSFGGGSFGGGFGGFGGGRSGGGGGGASW